LITDILSPTRKFEPDAMGSNLWIADILSRARKFVPDAMGSNLRPPDMSYGRQFIVKQSRKFEPDACGLDYFSTRAMNGTP
jgi:hypothetical protein